MTDPVSAAKSGSAFNTLSTNIRNLDQTAQNVTGVRRNGASATIGAQYDIKPAKTDSVKSPDNTSFDKRF